MWLKILLPLALFAETPEMIFTGIYNSWPWDESGFSFSGSQIEITRDYVDFLQNFLRENEIKTVVDIGCGDWAFSRYIDWTGIEYTGVDVVKMVIERNQNLFSSPTTHFILGNALQMDLPEGDLLICKDVFQHLSNKDISKILEKASKYKFCLFTDFVDPFTLTSENLDIETGSVHYVDLTKPPFNLRGKFVLTFFTVLPKKTLLITRSLDQLRP